MILALAVSPVLGVADATAGGGGLPDWATLLISVIAAIGGAGGFVQLAKVRSDRRSVVAGTEKARAEAADVISDTALSLVQPLRDQVDRLSAQVTTLELRLVQEREVSDARIKQLQADIADRDRHISSQGAEIIELRTRIRSAPGWPSSNS